MMTAPEQLDVAKAINQSTKNDEGAHPKSIPRVRLSFLLLLLLLHVFATIVIAQPGHLSIDEGVYHLMARAFAESGSLSVWNGYEEFPSDELRHPVLIVRDGNLYPQYPYLTAVVAWPFYAAMGYRGLFVMNAVAYVAVALLCFAMSRRIFGDVRLAIDSVIILTLASFAWQYSQEAWPHALSLMFIAAALYCTARGLLDVESRSTIRWALAAGLAIGFGAGIRLDSVFAIPAIALPYLFLAPVRLRPFLVTLAGLVPGLLVLAATNYLKFGIVSPFTYGGAGKGMNEIARYLPVLAFGLLGIVGLWAITRPVVRTRLGASPGPAALAAIAVFAGLLMVPPLAASVQKLGAGLLRLIVDFRLHDTLTLEPAMSLTPSGAVVYLGGLKKALLQSMPWLPLLALPLAAFARPNQPHRIFGMLFLLLAAYIVFYSYFAWHGGMALNLRYFLPTALPSSILGAWALRELRDKAPPAMLNAAIAAAPLAFLTVLYSVYSNLEAAEVEGELLTAPIVLAALLAFLLLLGAILSYPIRRGIAGATVIVTATAMGWGSAGVIGYDVLFSTLLRASYVETAGKVAPYLTPDSILFVHRGTAYFGLYDMNRIRLAATNQDDFAEFRPLLEYHLAAGRSVYLSFEEEAMEILQERNLLEGLTITKLSDDVSRVEIPAASLKPNTGSSQ